MEDEIPKQCGTCEHWLPTTKQEFTGRCCTAKSTSYKDITFDSDGCNQWERVEE